MRAAAPEWARAAGAAGWLTCIIVNEMESAMNAFLSHDPIVRAALPVMAAAWLAACAPFAPGAAPGAAPAAKPAPAALQPAESERAAFTWSATGTQNYECRTTDKGGWAWVFVAPEADLFNARQEKVGTHGAGPFWAAADGSRIVGTVKARADAESPTDIPLLLLSARPAGGAGRMADITSVQRLATRGGVAPATGCQTQADAGRQSKQPYAADYVFFIAK
jgi:Protein of unknown function (DUF3455)